MTLFSYLDERVLFFELTSHFRLQYFLFSAFGLFVLLLARHWKWCVFTLICFAVNGFEVVKWYFPVSNPVNYTKTETTQFLRLLLSNVHTINTEYSRVIELIHYHKPDIVVLQEIDEVWLDALKPLAGLYPYQISDPRPDNFGIALYSRIPFSNSEVIKNLGPSEIPSLKIEIKPQEKFISLFSTHPLPPINQQYFEERNNQLEKVARYIKNIPGHKIIIGDLNTTMWSPFLKRFENISELNNVRNGFGILPTWPAKFGYLGIPIDHGFVSSDIRVDNVTVLKSIGSDHLPLMLDLSI